MIQVVFVKWGTKYSAAYVNGLVEAVLKHTKSDIRFVCFTEDPNGLDPRIEARPFPDLSVPLEILTSRGGSLPKMSMFIEGELDPDMPTIYLDLDSAVMGDVKRLVAPLLKKRGLYLCQRHAVPYWRFRWLPLLFDKNRYYLGNTAIMSFFPGDWLSIGESFLRDFPKYQAGGQELSAFQNHLFKEGNEKIISSAARHVSRVYPRDTAIKFTQEYMSPFLWVARLKNHLPWVKARRARQAVLTFHGEALKPEHLAKKEVGELVSHKYHKTIWRYPEITRYWQDLLARG